MKFKKGVEAAKFGLKAKKEKYADLEFSQAATNSSWANFGYLVAKDIDEEDSDLIEKI